MNIIGVVESSAEYLRELIITGELAPGQRLNEAQLAQQLDISRAPLREALRTLESDHLVVSIPRKGCRVSEISIEDLRNLFEARFMIESFAIDLLKERNTRAVSEMAAAFQLANEDTLFRLKAVDKRQRLAHLKLLANIHIKLVESAGNERLIFFHRTLNYSMARYQYKYPYSLESFQHSQQFHGQIIKHIEAGQFDAANVTLKEHLCTFKATLEQRTKIEKD
jgi:DNA-binding GntR family transcriptional regulator